MFWRFGGYANISTLDSILDKPDVTLEEILDETDLIQELKQHNSKLIDYLRDEAILRRLFEYVIAPPIEVPDEDDGDDAEQEPEPAKKTFGGMRSLSLNRTKDTKSKRQEEREELDKQEKNRQKYAYAACEILASETWSIMEAMLEAKDSLRSFWSFLDRDAPLDPVTAGYFSKIVEPLLDKKTGETLEFIKSYGHFVPMVLKHIDTPNVMDVLLKMISVEKSEGGSGVIEWLHDQGLMPSLLAFVGPSHPTSTQIAAGDFIKAIVTISANASQNEQQCIGPNSLTRQLVSEECVRSLIIDMLEGGNPLTVGVGIVIEVIRKNNSDYDPEVDGGPDAPPSSSDPIYLGTLLRLFADHVPEFTALLTHPKYTLETHQATSGQEGRALKAAFGKTIEPLGFDRFKTCELMAELLHCSNMGLLNEAGSEVFVKLKDQERARLRTEGKLSRTRSGASNSEESHGYEARGSHEFTNEKTELGRKLEVTNSAEDDGFEELGSSSEIEESLDEKDRLAAHDASAAVQRIKPSKSRLSLDDEFFDEPLTSPKLGPSDEGPVPTDDTNISKPAGEREQGSNVPDASEKSTSEQLVDAIESQLGSGPLATKPAPLPGAQDHLTVSAAGPRVDRDLSPHPEDKPAPLFTNKASSEQQTKQEKPDEKQGEGVAALGTTASKDDTAGEPSPEVAVHATPPGPTEDDANGHSVVGDHLKMMFVEHKVIPTILDFFFRFPWNNFLHNVVYDVVQQVFNGPMDRGFNRFLAIDLFNTGKITDRIIEGQLRSDEAQAHSSMRLGYMGHLTLIAEEVVKFSERHPPEILSDLVIEKISSKIWTDYVDNTLAETRERDNAILGGVRPDAIGGPRQAVLNAVNSGNGFGNAGSSGLAGAGLGGSGHDIGENGGGGAGFVGGGSLLSGFGSSSDEEDEDMEEINEHDEGGSRNDQVGDAPFELRDPWTSVQHEDEDQDMYDQYPTYTPSSLSALSIFSPQRESHAADEEPGLPSGDLASASDSLSIPPPLNVPPSRARRQLAARLARHSQQEAGEGGSSIFPRDAATSLSAAFGSITGSNSEHDDSDPWATVSKPSSEGSGAASSDIEWATSPSKPAQLNSSEWVSFDDFDDQRQRADDSDEGEDVPIRLSFDDDDEGSAARALAAKLTSGDNDDHKSTEAKEAVVRSAID